MSLCLLGGVGDQGQTWRWGVIRMASPPRQARLVREYRTERRAWGAHAFLGGEEGLESD